MLGIMLQWGGYSFQNLLNQLEQIGFFQYILPFLLIFAVVYAILTKIPVFEKNRGAGIIVSLAVGLLALQFDIVPAFFQNIFPKFGVGLAILLVALILAGAFISETKENIYGWIFFGIGMFIFFIVVITSFADWRFLGSWWWEQYGTMILVGLAVIGMILAVILSGRGRSEEK